jgi:hypothetical protein
MTASDPAALARELEAALSGFTGSETLYQHWLRVCYTEGVRYLAERAGAYWFVDAVASHQRGRLAREGFQVWTLAVAPDRTAVLECRADDGAPVLKRQHIPFTDFPLPSVKLYLAGGVLMLPSEY